MTLAAEVETPRRGHGLAALLLGVALGATLLSWFVASGNFRVVDPQRDPQLLQIFADIPGDEARVLAMRYIANESNRSMFQILGPLQLGLVLIATALGWRASRRGPRKRWIRGLLPLTLICALATALLVPPIIRIGREIDFVSRTNGNPPRKQTFARLHGAYMAIDLIKVLGSATTAGLLLAAAADARRETA